MKRNSRRNVLIFLVILLTILIHFLIFLFLFVPLRMLFINPVLEQKLDEIHHKLHPPPPPEAQTPWVSVAPAQGAPVLMVDDADIPHTAARDTDTQEPPDAPEPQEKVAKEVARPQGNQMPEAQESAVEIAQERPDPNYIPPSLFKHKPVAQAPMTDVPDEQPTPTSRMPRKKMTLAKLADGFMADRAEARQTSSLSL